MTEQVHDTLPMVWVAIEWQGTETSRLWNTRTGNSSVKFAYRLDDYDRLVGFLRSTGAACRIAFEPTADYHRTLGFRLLPEGFGACRISSVAGARYRGAMFNRCDKNDPKGRGGHSSVAQQNLSHHYTTMTHWWTRHTI
jgi:transposase